MSAPPPQAIVIFGASGDLTRRKLLPAFYHLFLEGLLPEGFVIVGYARTEMDDAAFRAHARESIATYGRRPPEGQAWASFAEHLEYVTGEFSDPGAMDHIVQDLRDADARHGTAGGRFFYAATPPSAYPDIVTRIGEAGLAEGARIVFEKPFGYDLASAQALNAKIHEVFDESQVFRIDHYLGKETVQNILAFRFANGLFEPIWNRRYLDHVQITVAERIGVEGRGQFYEQTGAIRDMVSTHVFQMLTFLAMEPPVSFEPDRLRDETVKVLRAMTLCDPAKVVRGQYRGYRDEPGVSADSQVETFAAIELEIDNWRWADVPFLLRTGKRLREKVDGDHAEVPQGAVQRLPWHRGGAAEARPPHVPGAAGRGHHAGAERQDAGSGPRARPRGDGVRLRAGVQAGDRRLVRAAAPGGPGGRPHALSSARTAWSGRGRSWLRSCDTRPR